MFNNCFQPKRASSIITTNPSFRKHLENTKCQQLFSLKQVCWIAAKPTIRPYQQLCSKKKKVNCNYGRTWRHRSHLTGLFCVKRQSHPPTHPRASKSTLHSGSWLLPCTCRNEECGPLVCVKCESPKNGRGGEKE